MRCDDTVEIGYSPAEHDMMLTINSASFNQRAYEAFDELEFAQPVNYSHARLIWAASIGNLESLKAQLHSMVPDRIKTLALHKTIALWKYDCCQLLLDNGADPNGFDIDGQTPLTRAASELEIDIAALLHSYGAEIDRANIRGHKPLYLVCKSKTDDICEDISQRRLNIASLLLGRGADVDGTDIEGCTPLRHAMITVKDLDLVRLLLLHGACPDRQDSSGISSLDLAIDCKMHEYLDLMLEYVK